jgi:signal transduction histidine kinase/FixJ family two-component response regulator
MGAIMRQHDWSRSPLGPVETWSISPRMMVRFLLANRFPLLLWRGPQFCQLYNDAYRPILGTKHPQFLGRPVAECWHEIWHILEPLIRTPFEGGAATWMEDILLEINRYGFVEESHFTIAYSPVPDDTAPRGIGGVLATVHEISEKIVGERRTRALRDLGTGMLEERSAEEACARSAEILANYTKDIPFALLYLVDLDRKQAKLAGSAGVTRGTSICPIDIGITDGDNSAWPLSNVIKTPEIEVVENLGMKFSDVPSGPWTDPPNSAAIVPIHSTSGHQLVGFLVAGISPRLRFDDYYRAFFELTSSQIATAIANARAYEEERRRAEALAEIDRVKTAFFTNISHEFRTPLTLMLGPLEEALAEHEMSPEAHECLALAHRNSLRLLKLVNSLLDFSRIEGGRLQAVYEPVDLATLTSELAGVFRSAIERAGLRLIVTCPPLDQSVYVDREMWEKIVLNLLSNAFKFTLHGEIAVSVLPVGEVVELVVRDTGTGIATQDVPHIFERFYRVRNATGRSYEGSGIGLALVQELAKLHGGAVRVDSEPGKGSTFTVSIPLGFAHLPAERIGAVKTASSTATAASVYVEEALRSLSDSENVAEDSELIPALPTVTHPTRIATPNLARPRILVADDNADMRHYVQRLLTGNYEVVAAQNGETALQSALEEPPDLVLADVMMPNLDGFGLLKALRSDERTASVPVILLSARAGEESRVEGIVAGADDYLAKPFSARELLAHVENSLALSRLRRETEIRVRESEERFRALVAASSDVVYRMNADWTEMRHMSGRDFVAYTESPNRSWLQKYIHPDDQSRVMDAIAEAVTTKNKFELEHRVLRVDGSLGWTFSRAIPIQDANGEIVEWFGAATDITPRKQAEQALLRSEKLASVGRMAATIAHEINNPLEAVTNTLYLAQGSINEPEVARRYLDLAEGELKRVAHIARQSLGFYRESNAPKLTSINEVLQSAIDLLKNRIASTAAVIEKQWDENVEIVAVAGELRQVFSNLLSNSLDAIEKGGLIRVRVSARAASKKARRSIRVTIADNGGGVSTNLRSHIFEAFFTTKGTVGTGLGLWISKQIILKHGGTIQMRSSTDADTHGTVFSIVLPLEPGSDVRRDERATH